MFIRVGNRLASALRARRRNLYAAPRRRPLSARLADGCSRLFERLNRRWSRAACKMIMTFAAAAVAYMLAGNYLQQSFSSEIQQLSVEKQQYEKEHVSIQAELTNLIQKNKNKLGLIEGKPEQLIRMN
jgi:predicted PurR-regulated permease PerM